MRIILNIILILMPLVGFGQIPTQPKIYPSILEWQNCDVETFDHLPCSDPNFKYWIQQNSFRKIIVSSPKEFSDSSHVKYNEFWYTYDDQGRITDLMVFDIFQNLNEFTPEYKRSIEKLQIYNDTSNWYVLPDGFDKYIDENNIIKQILKKNERGDTVFFLHGKSSIYEHAIYNKHLLRQVQWNYLENSIVTFYFGPVETSLSGEFGSIYDTSFIEERKYVNGLLSSIKLVNISNGDDFFFPSPFPEGQDVISFKSNQYKLNGSKELLSTYLTDDTKHREEVFNFLAKINPIDSFEFEILEIPKSLTMWNHLIILFNVNSDNKVYHFIIVPPSSLSFHGTLIENLDDNRILKQTFMISGGQQIITNTEQYNTEGHILFEENQSGKRVNYFYSDGGQLVGETTLKRCRLNDNFSSKKKDLKKNYCINKNEINVVNPPFTQIQQYYKNMNMKGWSYTFNK